METHLTIPVSVPPEVLLSVHLSPEEFSQALREFIEFDRMLVFVTNEARETTWPVLRDLHDPRILPVSIPVGNDSDGLWTLFDRLIEHVAEGDTLIFDITHGLRSIPFLVFLAAAYLKTARNVTIEAILYGAYELGQPAPVIDLSEFVLNVYIIVHLHINAPLCSCCAYCL